MIEILAIKTITDLLLKLKSANEKEKSDETEKVIADLQLAWVYMKTDIKLDLDEYESEIKELKEKLKFKETLKRVGETYWINGELNKENGPFCATCWDSKKRISYLLHRLLFAHRKGTEFYCPNKDCHNFKIKISGYFPYGDAGNPSTGTVGHF